ncbi:MAG: hypothetical protein WC827_04040 [Candidatus Paceibacterota bacterium]|jgi:hypothetical protein
MEANAKNLSLIDSYFQNNPKFENEWEHGTTTRNYCGGEGWEGVQKNYPRNFENAWNAALLFMRQNNVEESTILKNNW